MFSGFTTPEAASSPPTQMDMSGYATLLSLNKHRRYAKLYYYILAFFAVT